jgi:dihydropyrimidinase
MRVYGEPLIQHLVLDETEYTNKDWDHAARRVMSPPFRNKQHQDSLWAGLQSGSLQVVATDHCAFTTKAEAHGVGNFTKIPTARAASKTACRCCGPRRQHRPADHERVRRGHLDQHRQDPQHVSRKGAIVVGADADLVVWDPKAQEDHLAPKQQSVIDYNVFEGIERMP